MPLLFSRHFCGCPNSSRVPSFLKTLTATTFPVPTVESRLLTQRIQSLLGGKSQELELQQEEEEQQPYQETLLPDVSFPEELLPLLVYLPLGEGLVPLGSVGGVQLGKEQESPRVGHVFSQNEQGYRPVSKLYIEHFDTVSCEYFYHNNPFDADPPCHKRGKKRNYHGVSIRGCIPRGY